MAHSVESRFLAIICGALLVFVGPLFVLFIVLSSERTNAEQALHIDTVLSVNARALEKPLWEFDNESIGRILDRIVAEPTVRYVGVSEPTGMMSFFRHRKDAPTADTTLSVSRPIIYETVDGPRKLGDLIIRSDKAGLFSSLREMERAFISIFIFAILGVFTVAIIGNRMIIITPLLRLTEAVEATRRLGSRHHVDWHSNDEMGQLASSFNAMQCKLEQEQMELKLAHRRATDIYNLTPAMLFSIDAEDRITAVSEYWLAATGYRRDEVIGRKFASMIEESSRSAYSGRKDTDVDTASTWNATVKFVRADGSVIDVLIHETRPDREMLAEGLSLSVMTDVTELKESEIRNRLQAVTDHLTGLMNRQGMEIALAERIGRADSEGRELALLYLDLDRFKWINDNLGHGTGDIVLRQFVGRMMPLLDPQDVAARIGGDEFTLLLLADDAEKSALALADGLNTLFENPFTVASGKTHVSTQISASIGIALYPRHAKTAADLLQKADMAMYARKRDGKNGYLLFDPSVMDNVRRHAEIEANIQSALRENWIDTFFQPIFALDGMRIKGFEALMRLRHPEKGILSPAEIIAVAEETGSMTRIGNSIMDRALAHLADVSRAPGLECTYLAINFSPMQFDTSLPARIAGNLSRHGIDPQRIVIEITEAVLMADNPAIRATLDECTRLGCRIALDDFGTGYSSLSYLNRFPVDIVKIDQSFTRGLTDPNEEIRKRSRMLVEGISAISHKMECDVIAEGIETTEQLDLLKKIGVDHGQGYLMAKPMPVTDIISSFADSTPQKTGAAWSAA